jgi:acyl-coenzyme A thioesterase PaaI-like protein
MEPVSTRLFKIVESAERLNAPVANALLGAMLRIASPFNAPLRAAVETWKPHVCRVRIRNRRALHNHLGGVHAGALVTAGETPAGLLILKSFPLSRYRLILKGLAVEYGRQAHTDVVAEAKLPDEQLLEAQQALRDGRPALLNLETVLSEPSGARLATVRSQWQVKEWSKVRGADGKRDGAGG